MASQPFSTLRRQGLSMSSPFQLDWQVSEPPGFTSLLLNQYWGHRHAPSMYVHTEAPSSGPHACLCSRDFVHEAIAPNAGGLF